MSDSNSGETILAFILGGLIGACLGMFYAPQAGKQTRKKVKVFLEDLSEKAGELAEESKGKIGDLVSAAKEKVTSKK